MINYKEGDIVAHWRDGWFFAEFITTIKLVDYQGDKCNYILLKTPANSDAEVTVYPTAVAPLTPIQEQEYIMAKLEGRNSMIIKEI